MSHVGPIRSHVAGRTDDIPLTVALNSYVIPADVISGLGQGNTDAGYLAFEKKFGVSNASKPKFATGGRVETRPIMAAGGEYVLGPDDVARIGKGDPAKGHDALDSFVKSERAKIIKTMRKLPGPKKRD